MYYEGLQDKLAQVRDARAALNALRDEHREKLRRAAEEAERQRQIQLAQKLEIMRQKKQVRVIKSTTQHIDQHYHKMENLFKLSSYVNRFIYFFALGLVILFFFFSTVCVPYCLQEYLEMQRQLAIQRLQEQEKERQLRLEQQKHTIQMRAQMPAFSLPYAQVRPI